MTPEEIQKKFEETFAAGWPSTTWSVPWPDASQEVLDAGFYRAGFEGPVIRHPASDEPDTPFIVG